MPVTLASRALIVQKMDKQFNEDLKMRKDTTVVSKAWRFYSTRSSYQTLLVKLKF